jgi:hypothetical protein
MGAGASLFTVKLAAFGAGDDQASTGVGEMAERGARREASVAVDAVAPQIGHSNTAPQ